MKSKEIKIHLMATNIYLKLFHQDNDFLENISKKVIDKLESYNQRFNMYNPDSELSYINDNAWKYPIKIKDDLFDLIKIGLEHSRDNNSNLNVAIAPLVKLWNIGLSDANIPTDNEIIEALEISNPNLIKLYKEENSIYFEKKGIQLDLGAIAKGYIADLIIDYLIDKGIKGAYINLGGNVLTYGLNYDSADYNWRIGLQNPNKERGSHLLLLAINDMSIVTSGVYERKSIIENKEYHHIIDPKTGYPVESTMKSISVISRKSVDCEIWTSKLFGKDINDVLKITENIPEIDIIIIGNDNNLYYSQGVERYILWKEEI